MFMSKWALVAAAALAALLSLSKRASADGVVITSQTELWGLAIQASGDANGNWTGKGMLAHRPFQPPIATGQPNGGINGQPRDGIFAVTIVANLATGEWEVIFQDLGSVAGVGRIRRLP
jgi:hypothetical protein